MKQTEESIIENIVGYVVASQIDEYDRIMGVIISSEDDEYEVEMSGLGEKLLDFIDEEVEVRGIVDEERDGSKWITVIGYDVLENGFDEDSDDVYLDDLDLEDLDFASLEAVYAY